jgi:serine/threonine protein kinase
MAGTEIHLVDFGLAKLLKEDGEAPDEQGLTRSGVVIGTPLYMSPEQARGRDLDLRTDIYSFGCVMYMALTGEPPFYGESYVDTIMQHLNDVPPPIDPKLKIPNDLKTIVFKAMEKEPENRYQSAEQLASDLDKVARGAGVGYVPLPTQQRKIKQRLVNVVYFAAAFIAVYVVSLLLQDHADQTHRDPASIKHQASGHH